MYNLLVNSEESGMLFIKKHIHMKLMGHHGRYNLNHSSYFTTVFSNLWQLYEGWKNLVERENY